MYEFTEIHYRRLSTICFANDKLCVITNKLQRKFECREARRSLYSSGISTAPEVFNAVRCRHSVTHDKVLLPSAAIANTTVREVVIYGNELNGVFTDAGVRDFKQSSITREDFKIQQHFFRESTSN